MLGHVVEPLEYCRKHPSVTDYVADIAGMQCDERIEEMTEVNVR